MLSNKIVSNEKITLVEGDDIVKTENEIATILNNFFSNIFKKLEIEPYETNDNVCQNYLTNRKQRTKINSEYSSWEEIVVGVPQDSILGPLLFNIFMCDLFFIVNNIDFASYADDNTPYATGNCMDDVVLKLENTSKTLFQWFKNNQLNANPEKCHFIFSS